MLRRTFVKFTAAALAAGCATTNQTAPDVTDEAPEQPSPAEAKLRRRNEIYEEQLAWIHSHYATVRDLMLTKYVRYDVGKGTYSEPLSLGGAAIARVEDHVTWSNCSWATTEFLARLILGLEDAYAKNPKWRVEFDDTRPSKVLSANQLAASGQIDTSLASWTTRQKFTKDGRNRLVASTGGFELGAADALVMFGMGRTVSYEQWKAGDIIEIFQNGTGAGHSVVFQAYLAKDPGKDEYFETSDWSDAVVGFKFFSANKATRFPANRGSKAGAPGELTAFGYKWASMNGIGPTNPFKLRTADGSLLDIPRGAIHTGLVDPRRVPFHQIPAGRLLPPVCWDTTRAPQRIERYMSFKSETLSKIEKEIALSVMSLTRFPTGATLPADEDAAKAEAARIRARNVGVVAVEDIPRDPNG